MIEGYTATVTGTITDLSDISVDVCDEKTGEIVSMAHYHITQHTVSDDNSAALHKEAAVGARIACAYETEYVEDWDSDDMVERHTLIDYDLLGE